MVWMKLFPICMVILNAGVVVFALVAECRIKPNALRYMFMYATTVVPAAKGDMNPFFAVFTMPPM